MGPGGTSNMMYYDFGFVPLQDMFDRALVDFFAERHVASPSSFVQQFPVPAYNSVRYGEPRGVVVGGAIIRILSGFFKEGINSFC